MSDLTTAARARLRADLAEIDAAEAEALRLRGVWLSRALGTDDEMAAWRAYSRSEGGFRDLLRALAPVVRPVLAALLDAADERDRLAERVRVLEEALRPFARILGDGTRCDDFVTDCPVCAEKEDATVRDHLAEWRGPSGDGLAKCEIRLSAIERAEAALRAALPPAPPAGGPA